jgi:hypothetical protein
MIPDAGRKHVQLLNEREGTPWRYVCPKCGSSAVYPRTKLQDDACSGRVARNAFYCGGHSGTIPSVYDKRQGVEVRNV